MWKPIAFISVFLILFLVCIVYALHIIIGCDQAQWHASLPVDTCYETGSHTFEATVMRNKLISWQTACSCVYSHYAVALLVFSGFYLSSSLLFAIIYGDTKWWSVLDSMIVEVFDT